MTCEGPGGKDPDECVDEVYRTLALLRAEHADERRRVARRRPPVWANEA